MYRGHLCLVFEYGCLRDEHPDTCTFFDMCSECVECVLIQLLIALWILKPAGGHEWKRIGSQETVLNLIGDEMHMFLGLPTRVLHGLVKPLKMSSSIQDLIRQATKM